MNHKEAFDWVFRRRHLENSLREWRTVEKIIHNMPEPIDSVSLHPLLSPRIDNPEAFSVYRSTNWSVKLQLQMMAEIMFKSEK